MKKFSAALAKPTQLAGAVLFDMDGTLTDSEALWWRAERDICARAGYDMELEEAQMSIGKSLLEAAECIVDYTGIDMKPVDYVDALTARVEELAAQEGLPWRPGAYELLSLLAELDIPSALVTSSYRSFAKYVLEKAPSGTLEVVVTGDMALPGKPQPAPYLEAAHLLNVEIENCLAFEDSVPGLYAAYRSGAQTFAVPFVVDLPTLPGVKFLESLAEVNREFLRRYLPQFF